MSKCHEQLIKFYERMRLGKTVTHLSLHSGNETNSTQEAFAELSAGSTWLVETICARQVGHSFPNPHSLIAFYELHMTLRSLNF